ncbi:MAG: ABC transporter ATP-binding protein [Candidatus Hadarchaeales archaeon]
MVKIVLKNLCKSFGEVKAVDDINLEIKNREFMVLLGPSGCGKTTILRMIAGLEKPTSGKIYFDGKVVNDLEPKERNIAMVFQEYALYPHMSVADNMSLCLQVDRVPKEEIARRLKTTAELLQIEKLLHRKPSELSGGQQQRVALGRAIIRNPSVFLMDEPLSNLDAILRIAMRAELKKLQEKLRTTTIYVTHDQAEAMVLADRVAVLKDGKLLQLDTPRNIYDHPVDKFVAEFIGSPRINFVKCRIVRRGAGTVADAGPFSIVPPQKASDALRRSKSTGATLGVRPEDVHVLERKERGSIEGKVYFFQQMGNVGYVDVDMGDGIRITASVDPDFDARPGEKVFVRFDERRMKFFDEETGKLIA